MSEISINDISRTASIFGAGYFNTLRVKKDINKYEETGIRLKEESKKVPETYNSKGKTIKQEDKGYNFNKEA